ncbi:protein FMP32, mitochondrial-like [Tripterygium wilfordii]|nr:protein FMP32, mitochondrial-like [Tripterygium wilfordii]
MAAAVACKRVGQFGTTSGIGFCRFRGFAAADVVNRSSYDPLAARSSIPVASILQHRQISQLSNSNGSRLFLVDTLALVRRLESQGLPTKQAEAITAVITEVLNDSLENVSHSFVSKAEVQKIEMIQEANLSKFKSEVQSLQKHHFSLLQREAEKLQNDIEKLRNEFRYEIDKVTAGQRLDWNLERGKIRDELTDQSAQTSTLTNKLDREIHALRAQVEAAKYEVIKYCIGTLVSISAVGLAVVRIFM